MKEYPRWNGQLLETGYRPTISGATLVSNILLAGIVGLIVYRVAQLLKGLSLPIQETAVPTE